MPAQISRTRMLRLSEIETTFLISLLSDHILFYIIISTAYFNIIMKKLSPDARIEP